MIKQKKRPVVKEGSPNSLPSTQPLPDSGLYDLPEGGGPFQAQFFSLFGGRINVAEEYSKITSASKLDMDWFLETKRQLVGAWTLAPAQMRVPDTVQELAGVIDEEFAWVCGVQNSNWFLDFVQRSRLRILAVTEVQLMSTRLAMAMSDDKKTSESVAVTVGELGESVSPIKSGHKNLVNLKRPTVTRREKDVEAPVGNDMSDINLGGTPVVPANDYELFGDTEEDGDSMVQVFETRKDQ